LQVRFADSRNGAAGGPLTGLWTALRVLAQWLPGTVIAGDDVMQGIRREYAKEGKGG